MKDPHALPIYYEAKSVPFEFVEMGRILINQTYRSKGDQAGQIRMVREKAAELGADAVIVLRQSNVEGQGSLVGGIGMASSRTTYNVEGVAIRKK